MKKTIELMMTENVHSIGKEISLKVAAEQMRRFGIRHLPVLNSGNIVGVLSERDIFLMNKFSGKENFTVEDAMTQDPFVVAPDALFSEVSSAMAEHKYGCTIVAVDGKPLGIFTAVDGMRLLAAAYK